MADKLPIEDFIRQHVKSIGYDYRQDDDTMREAYADTFRAAEQAGYTLDVSFVSLFHTTLGVKAP